MARHNRRHRSPNNTPRHKSTSRTVGGCPPLVAAVCHHPTPSHAAPHRELRSISISLAFVASFYAVATQSVQLSPLGCEFVARSSINVLEKHEVLASCSSRASRSLVRKRRRQIHSVEESKLLLV